MSIIQDWETKRQELLEKREGRVYSIYAIRCKTNGKIYVGCTYDVRKRIKAHFQQLRRGQKRSHSTHNGTSAWQRDYDQYGEAAFEYYVLQENVPYANKSATEAYWMMRLNAKENEHGYNAQDPHFTQLIIPFVPGLPPEEGNANAIH